MVLKRPSRRDLQPRFAGRDTRHWALVLVVLAGALGISMVERWMRPREAPVSGRAMVSDGDTLTIAGVRVRLIDIDAPESSNLPRPAVTSGRGRQASQSARTSAAAT